MQTISMRSGCPWSTCQRRASLIIASFASVPLLQKKNAVREAQPRQLLRQADLRLGEIEVRGVPEELRLLQHRLAHTVDWRGRPRRWRCRR